MVEKTGAGIPLRLPAISYRLPPTICMQRDKGGFPANIRRRLFTGRMELEPANGLIAIWQSNRNELVIGIRDILNIIQLIGIDRSVSRVVGPVLSN
jgi:hypothetical protein